MTPLLYILTGYLLCLILSRLVYKAVSLSWFVLSLFIAARLVLWIVPEMNELNWRSAGASAVLAFVLVMLAGSLWFWVLGWRARADKTMDEKIERAKADNVKDRKIA